MMIRFWRTVRGRLLLAAVGMAVFLVGMVVVSVYAVRENTPPPPPSVVADFTVIPLSSETVTLSPRPSPVASPTPIPQVTLPPVPSSEEIVPGAFVQINGTGGDGLRLRAEPGLDGAVQYVALESEVFQVQDGPQERDGYTWWLLVAPYDATRQGWAVSNYLLKGASHLCVSGIVVLRACYNHFIIRTFARAPDVQ